MSNFNIYGTQQDFYNLKDWCSENNEKILDFMPAPFDPGSGLVISMPHLVHNWFHFNCFLDFVKDHYDIHPFEYKP